MDISLDLTLNDSENWNSVTSPVDHHLFYSRVCRIFDKLNLIHKIQLLNQTRPCTTVRDSGDILEQSPFKKYTTCWVFLALCDMLYLCICILYLRVWHMGISFLIQKYTTCWPGSFYTLLYAVFVNLCICVFLYLNLCICLWDTW